MHQTCGEPIVEVLEQRAILEVLSLRLRDPAGLQRSGGLRSHSREDGPFDDESAAYLDLY